MDKKKLAKVWMWINLILGVLAFILFAVFGIRVIIAVAGDKGLAVWIWNSILMLWFFITAVKDILAGLAWKKKLKG